MEGNNPEHLKGNNLELNHALGSGTESGLDIGPLTMHLQGNNYFLVGHEEPGGQKPDKFHSEQNITRLREGKNGASLDQLARNLLARLGPFSAGREEPGGQKSDKFHHTLPEGQNNRHEEPGGQKPDKLHPSEREIPPLREEQIGHRPLKDTIVADLHGVFERPVADLVKRGGQGGSPDEVRDAIIANLPDPGLGGPLGEIRDRLLEGKIGGWWTDPIKLDEGLEVIFTGQKHVTSQVLRGDHEEAQWWGLRRLSEALRYAEEKGVPLVILSESQAPPSEFVARQGSGDPYEIYKAFARAREDYDGIPPEQGIWKAFNEKNEMQFEHYLVAHNVEFASVHRAAETGDLGQLRFSSEDRILMRSWDPTTKEIAANLNDMGFSPFHITLDQLSKSVLGIIHNLPPDEQQLPIEKVFNGLVYACNISGWMKEELARYDYLVAGEKRQISYPSKEEMRKIIDPRLNLLNREMQRLSAQLHLGPDGQGFLLAKPTQEGYQRSWNPRDQKSFEGVFNAPAGKHNPKSLLQYMSYVNSLYRHVTGVRRLFEAREIAQDGGVLVYGHIHPDHGLVYAQGIARGIGRNVPWHAYL